MKHLKKTSFQKKLLFTYVLFIVFACVIYVFTCLSQMKSAKAEAFSYSRQMAGQLSLTVDSIFPTIDNTRFLHFYDLNIRGMLEKKKEDKTVTEQLNDTHYLNNTFAHLRATNQYITQVTIVTRYGDVYSDASGNLTEYLEQMKPLEKEQDWSKKRTIYFSDVYSGEFDLLPFRLVTCISKMYDIFDSEPIATLYIDFDYAKMEDTFRKAQMQDGNGGFLILGKERQLIYSSPDQDYSMPENRRDIFQDFSSNKPLYASFHDGKSMIAAVKNEKTDWVVIHYMPLSKIYYNAFKNMFGFLLGMGLLLFSAIAAALLIARQISNPIALLLKTMKKTENGKVALIEESAIPWQDEMGTLLRNYNRMGEQINDSIERIYIYQLARKQAELKMLQFQINPHFLYNTLNTISSIAELMDIPEIVELSDSLAGMFRYNIKGNDIVALEEELSQVKKFLKIQTIRFPNRFSFSFDIEEGMEQEPILKFLLQPLVENSLKHAFPDRTDSNRISISARKTEREQILLLITDNGCGIQAGELEELNEELLLSDSSSLVSNQEGGIGLKNVNARIKNFYGKEYGIRLESVPKEYTAIRISLKSLKQEENIHENRDCR